MNKTHCKNCLRVLEAHTPVEDLTDVPKPGDYTVCLYCGLISRFDNDLNLIRAANNELKKFKRENKDAYTLLKVAQSIILRNTRNN